MRGDGAIGQGGGQPAAGFAVLPLGRPDQPRGRLVRPQADGQVLQQVAHPARAESQAAVHALDGALVAGEHGHAQVGAVGLRRRPHERPMPGRTGQGMQGCAGNARAVIVFDEEQVVGAGRQQPPQRLGAFSR